MVHTYIPSHGRCERRIQEFKVILSLKPAFNILGPVSEKQPRVRRLPPKPANPSSTRRTHTNRQRIHSTNMSSDLCPVSAHPRPHSIITHTHPVIKLKTPEVSKTSPCDFIISVPSSPRLVSSLFPSFTQPSLPQGFHALLVPSASLPATAWDSKTKELCED